MPPHAGAAAGAAVDAITQPRPLNTESVMTRFRGTFDKWVAKVTDLDKHDLESRLVSLEKRSHLRVLNGQINIWYVLAVRNKTRADKAPVPPPVRAKILEFITDPAGLGRVASDCGGMSTLGSSVLEQYDARDVIPYFLEKIRASVETGTVDLFDLTQQILDGAPSLPNNERPRIDIIVVILIKKGFEIIAKTGEGDDATKTWNKWNLIEMPNQHTGWDQHLPLPLRVRINHWGHATIPRLFFAKKVVDCFNNNLAGRAGHHLSQGEARKPAPFWSDFKQTISRSGDEVVKYLLNLFSATLSKGIPLLEISREVMEQAPKLPSGESYPLGIPQLHALHRELPSSLCLLFKLSDEQEAKGFTIVPPNRVHGNRVDDAPEDEAEPMQHDADPLPFFLHAQFNVDKLAI
ncbi:unnamed protein product [Amoebophrya sp. A120]|nr:unnamed protein product [Amoebophrya sp. A120]|eukprot:GSA120T00012924001.1